jgi:hypothetical protein
MSSSAAKTALDCRLDSKVCALVLLREILIVWKDTMLPKFQRIAKSRWGEGWLNQCTSILGTDMRMKIAEGYEWDCYRLALVYMKHPATFYPEYEAASDCERELYRYAYVAQPILAKSYNQVAALNSATSQHPIN